VATAIALAASGSSSRAKVVGMARNKTLHATILVNRSGHSLYALSVERHGRFICTNMACLSLWKPLTVKNGVKPTGVAGLGTVKRPDGRIQVAYRGAPLYAFSMDRKRGDVNGNGFKDVGTWRVVALSKSHTSGAAAPPPPPSYGY